MEQQGPPPFASLDEVTQRILSCPDCALSSSRTRAVPGEGPPNPLVMLVGEGPGFHEDQQGRPFVGAAGRFLEQLLQLAGLERGQVFITNVVKCRPPNNRDPLPGEVRACAKYLQAQIHFLQPRVIVTLGRHSLAWFFPNESVTRARGKPRQWNGITVVPMLHPAAALHQQQYRRTIEEDFRQLPAILQRALAERQPRAAPTPPPQQLSMFDL